MKYFPKDVQNTYEAKILSKLISKILKQGCSISVNDGEAFAVKKSTDRKEIEDNCFNTEEFYFRIRNTKGEKLGAIFFVHNSGENPICDHTDNEFIKNLVAKFDGL